MTTTEALISGPDGIVTPSRAAEIPAELPPRPARVEGQEQGRTRDEPGASATLRGEAADLAREEQHREAGRDERPLCADPPRRRLHPHRCVGASMMVPASKKASERQSPPNPHGHAGRRPEPVVRVPEARVRERLAEADGSERVVARERGALVDDVVAGQDTDPSPHERWHELPVVEQIRGPCDEATPLRWCQLDAAAHDEIRSLAMQADGYGEQAFVQHTPDVQDADDRRPCGGHAESPQLRQ